GMLATFADMMLPMLAHRQAVELRGQFLPTVSLQIDYLAPSPLGAWVQGEAQVLRITRNLAFVQGLVTADDVPALRVSGIFKIGKPFTPRQPT
ncbi:MAG TPA: PaaI family thioesterase, partial [Aquabacterium sp.]|nr:PaaI family thioesterase [Aquabacterium sp.]